MPLYLIVWIHLVAAITFIGGLVYVHLILRPVIFQSQEPESHTREVLRRTGLRFRTVTWMSLITLILTGAFNMLSEGGSARIETEWGVILMLKLFLFAIVFGLVLVHDFVLDPYASTAQPASPSSAMSGEDRRAAYVQQGILVLTLIILLVATYLSAM